MKKGSKQKTFRELEAEWYGKLKKAGFVDIESANPGRPLNEWHSRKFCSERSRIRQEQRERYNRQIDDFINHNQLHEICELISNHGNSTVKPKTVKKILELHRNGKTERAIAKTVRRGKKCVHLTLKKAREWMRVA